MWKVDTESVKNVDQLVLSSLQPSSYCHLDEGEKILDDELVKKFPHNSREFLKDWYKPENYFKTRTSNEYPTNSLRLPYQYAVAMVCKIYREENVVKSKISWVPLIHYVTFSGSLFDWANILSSMLKEEITINHHMAPRNFPSFHMSSYLLDMMCVIHAYSRMGWYSHPSDPLIHIYYKVLWEHKYRFKY
jgi:hypothetical protein